MINVRISSDSILPKLVRRLLDRIDGSSLLYATDKKERIQPFHQYHF